ncbi:type II toxin-antitoxin system RelE/ParE family toxin [Empedobacter falsenii]
MIYKIRISSEAAQDIEQAISYYSNFSTSAAKSYLAELTKVLEALEINPFYQVKYRNLRAKPFKSFPYLFFFETNEEEKTFLFMQFLMRIEILQNIQNKK